MDLSRDAVRGLAEAGAPSGSCSVTYGPNRPPLATSWWPLTGSVPSCALAGGLAEQLLGLLDGQLVGGHVLGDVDPLPVALQVGAVAADPDDDVGASQREGADVPGVDVTDVADQRLQAGTGVGVLGRPVGAGGLGSVAVAAEVEAAQPGHPLALAAGDGVQDVFHPGGELVVDELAEVPLEQGDDGEGQVGGHQRGALLEHVAAVQDGADDRGVGGRPADLPVLQLLDQRGLGVAGRRPGGVLGRGQPQHVQRVALGQRRQPALAVVAVGVRVVGALDVGLEEAVEVDDLAGGGELGSARRRWRRPRPGPIPTRRWRPSSGRRRCAARSARTGGARRTTAPRGRPGPGCGSCPRPGGWPRAPPGRS